MMRTSRLSFSARITKTGFKAGRGAEPFQHFEQYSGITHLPVHAFDLEVFGLPLHPCCVDILIDFHLDLSGLGLFSLGQPYFEDSVFKGCFNLVGLHVRELH